ECLIVRVSGDSMKPAISNGSFIAIRPVSATGLVFWGQIYVVVTDNYRMVKYLRRHPDPAYVVLHSDNPDYDDIEMPRDEIQALYIVETVINYDRRC
ncbi:MAG: S24 family peptidase, partial [Muribaculaceae bacterium]|nr:S24 family peptidase [Muribaculaceae bacterium]